MPFSQQSTKKGPAGEAFDWLIWIASQAKIQSQIDRSITRLQLQLETQNYVNH